MCIALVVASLLTLGVETTFGPNTPARLPILALIAVVILVPVVRSALFRSHRYGVTITKEALIVESWWRTKRIARSELSAAEPLPAVMRLSDGFFSGQGNDAAPSAVWLCPKDVQRNEFPLSVTTASWEATALACRKINAWLGVDIDITDDPAKRLDVD